VKYGWTSTRQSAVSSPQGLLPAILISTYHRVNGKVIWCGEFNSGLAFTQLFSYLPLVYIILYASFTPHFIAETTSKHQALVA
jgi:hypothetical protein